MNEMYLSSAELEELGEGLVKAYQKGEKKDDQVDIEGFIRDYLKLPIEYAKFAEEDKDKIGFLSDGMTPLRVFQKGYVTQVCFPKGTIVLDDFLQDENEKGRKRFTLAHEASHFLMERMNPEGISASFHSEYDEERNYTLEDLAKRLTLAEYQADRMAAAILMPRYMVEKALLRFNGGKPLPIYGDNLFRKAEKIIIAQMAQMLGVSFTALRIRLKGFKLLEQHDISEYIQQELKLGGI